MPLARSVHIQLPEAQRRADLEGVGNDLRATIDLIKLYQGLSLVPPSYNSYKISDCVITAIFVRYGRCFGKDARGGLGDEMLEQLTAEEREIHKLAKAIRDKHYAHSDNALERQQVAVWLTEADGSYTVTSVGASTNYISGGDPTILFNLDLLAKKLLAWVQSEQKKESARLLPIVLSKYSIDELVALIGNVDPHKVTFGELSKKRKGV